MTAAAADPGSGSAGRTAAEPTRVLVTGANGFVGRHLLAALRERWPQAWLIAANREHAGEEPVPTPADATVSLDLLDADGVRAVVRDAQPDACFHLAALSGVGEAFADPDAAWRANVDGTRALADATLRYAPHCTLVHASSAEVYGLSFRDVPAGEPGLGEDAPLRPANPYAAAKAAADLCLGEMALRGLRVVRMRPLNHTGPGQSARFAVPSFARQIARVEAGLQPPVLRVGALHPRRDFLDVRDVSAAYVAALTPLPAGSVLNLASGRLRRIGDVLDDLLRLAGVDVRVELEAAELRPLDLAETPLSAAVAQRLIGWAPRVAWEQTLLDTLAHWRREVRSAPSGDAA